MMDFGDIVLTRFPFTDLSGSKVRPALEISTDNARRRDVVLAFITSNASVATIPDALAIYPDAGNGLKVPIQRPIRQDRHTGEPGGRGKARQSGSPVPQGGTSDLFRDIRLRPPLRACRIPLVIKSP